MNHPVDRIADPWGERTPYDAGAPWPARTDMHLREGVAEQDVQRWVQAASVLHSNGDAMDVAVRDGRMVGVRGRAVDRVNRGRPGPKDLYGWQTNASPDRLTRPLIRENGRLVECDWDTAMNRITGRTGQLLDDEGPGSIGFYTSGQLFRLLDRLEGGDPPRLVCVDPRYTHVARAPTSTWRRVRAPTSHS